MWTFKLIGGLPYLVMDWVAGETLKQRLEARNGPYPVATVDAWMRALCEAMTHMQAHGVVHRDIKPGNILITPNGQPVLIDFGIALLRSTAEQDPLARMPAGAASYMAPEQMAGHRVDVRADIYSLGTIIFELLTLARPFADVERGVSTDLRWQRLLEAKTTRDAPSVARYREDLSPSVVAAVDGALARRPEARWPTPASLSNAWGSSTAAPPDVVRSTARRRTLALVAVAFVILVGIGFVILGGGGGSAPRLPVCQSVAMQDGVQWTTCVDSATLNADRLRVAVRWAVVIPAGQARNKLSDEGNPNMYLEDSKGQRYAAIAAGGAAVGKIVLKGTQTLQGWFEFAIPAVPSEPLAFVDDDMSVRVRFTLP